MNFQNLGSIDAQNGTNKTHPEIVDVTPGSIDRPETFTSTSSVFEDTKLALVMT
jgi:hypothetical protein